MDDNQRTDGEHHHDGADPPDVGSVQAADHPGEGGEPLEEAVLQEAIEENPEEVARLIERLGLVNELLDATEVVTSAMDDRMVRDLSGTSATLASAADAAATDGVVVLGESVGENGADLAAALETLAEMQRDGTMDELRELTDVLSLAGDALDDEMVRRLAGTGANLGGLADAAADERTLRGIERMLTAVGEADAADPEGVGAIGLIRALRDSEVQMGLGYVIAIARAMGQELSAEQRLAEQATAEQRNRETPRERVDAQSHESDRAVDPGQGQREVTTNR